MKQEGYHTDTVTPDVPVFWYQTSVNGWHVDARLRHKVRFCMWTGTNGGAHTARLPESPSVQSHNRTPYVFITYKLKLI